MYSARSIFFHEKWLANQRNLHGGKTKTDEILIDMKKRNTTIRQGKKETKRERDRQWHADGNAYIYEKYGKVSKRPIQSI